MKRKQTLGIKSLRYAAFAVCMCALTLVQFSCKEPKYIDTLGGVNSHADNIITLKTSDPANVKLKTESIKVSSNLEWKSIKAQADKNITLLNDAEFDKWTLTPEIYAEPISSGYKFTGATTIYAHVKPKIEVTIKTDEAKAEIKGKGIIRVKKNTLWQNILPEALSIVEAKPGSYIEGWYEGENASGAKLTHVYSFTQNTSVYAKISSDPVGEVNVTVTGDSNIEISEANSFNVPKDSLWGITVKQEAEKKAKAKKGYKIKEWKLISANGTVIGSDSKFSKSTVVYAVSIKDGSEPEPKPGEDKITVAVLGDINQVEIKSPSTFEVKKGSPWTEVKKSAEKLVKAKAGFKLTGWKLGSASGKDIADTYVFNDSPSIVYAVSAPDGTQPQPKDMIDILVRCDISEGDILAPSKITVAKGTKWKEVKVAAAKLVKVKKSGAVISEWKKGSAGGAAIKDEDLINENNFVAYAVITGGSVPAPQPETVTVIVTGDSNVGVKTSEFTVSKDSSWGQIKARALGCISLKNGASLKEWRRNASNGEVLQDSTAISPSPFTAFAVTNTLGGGGSKYPVFFSVDPSLGGGTVSAKIKGESENLKSGDSVPEGSVVVFTADPEHEYFVEYWIGVDSLKSNYGKHSIEVVINKPYAIRPNFIVSYFGSTSFGFIYMKADSIVTDNRIIIPDLIGHKNGDIVPKKFRISLDDEEKYDFHKAVANADRVEEIIMARSEITYLYDNLCSKLKGLKRVILPDNISRIGYKCFTNNSELEIINMPKGLRNIDGRAFEGCIKLRNLTLPEKLIGIGSQAFKGIIDNFTEIIIPKNVIGMGQEVFSGCTNLTVTLAHSEEDAYLVLGSRCFGIKSEPGSCCKEVRVKNETIKNKVIETEYYDGPPQLIIVDK